MCKLLFDNLPRLARIIFSNCFKIPETPPLVEDKPIREKIINLYDESLKILDDLSSIPLTNQKIIDNRILKSKRKLYKLSVDIKKLEKELYSSDNTLNNEQQLYNWWNQFWKLHPIFGSILGFLILTFLTALLTVWTENLLSEKTNCSCGYCNKVEQTISSINNDFDITINIQFGY